MTEAPPPGDRPPGPLTLLQVIGSVLAAFFGVQSSRHRARDFERGRPAVFLIVGLVATVGFVLLLVVIVNVVLHAAR